MLGSMNFGYVLLYVEDVPATVAFYEAAFGLAQKMIHEDGYAEMETGATTLGFVAHKTAATLGTEYRKPRREDPAPAVEVGFVTQDVDAAYDRAVDHGAAPVKAPEPKPWGQTVSYVRDLDGFLVEICSPVTP